MGASLTIPPEYDPALFVDRDYEIDRVVNLVRDLAAGRTVPRRTVIFRGERGCGKSWLLKHLAEDAYLPGDSSGKVGRQLAAVQGVKSWYMSLADFRDATPEDNVKAIIRALREQIGQWLGVSPAFSGVDNLTLYELSNLVVHDVQGLLQTHVLVWMLDHVYESSSGLLAVLEDRLLAPLTQHSKLLIVMAGRGRGFAWKTADLRFRVNEYWLQGLGVPAKSPPLTMRKTSDDDVDNVDDDADQQRSATEQQLNKLRTKGYSIAKGPDEILPETLGHPWSNFLVATAKSKSEIIATLLEGIPPEKLQMTLQMLRLACVLRFFDEPQISGLLAACGGDAEFRDIAGMQPREIIGALLETDLVRYDTNLAAYVMDEVIRRPLEGDLQERSSDLWQRLHRAAWDMYCGWVREYSQAKERLQAEADHHAKRLGKGACPEPQAQEES